MGYSRLETVLGCDWKALTDFGVDGIRRKRMPWLMSGQVGGLLHHGFGCLVDKCLIDAGGQCCGCVQ
jgi:hypothetical protein